MTKIIFIVLGLVSFAFSMDEINEADCLIIKEENSIICKYSAQREIEDKFIDVEWIDPEGDISRSRKIIMPSGHGSVYDFRYINGRMPGIWTFKVVDKDKTFTTNFELTFEE